ncbi:MAG: TonB C-terminal domain-containing protein [Helicobacteraceae bacterium]|jgi:hypothetical protein|nr:TonB C-terminal domain-containing protein [Helicobacteraceae bacterium]
MDERGSPGWFCLSGTISLAISAAFFAGLLSYLLYRAPTFSFSPSELWEDFEIDEAWLKDLSVQQVDLVDEMGDLKEERVSPQKSVAESVKELFGESNSTAKPEELLTQVTPIVGRVAIPDFKLDDTRDVKKPDLAAFKALNTSKPSAQEAATQKSLEARYYKELYKRLYNAWQVRNSDLGRMARIEMRVDRGGEFTYRIVSAPDDPSYRERLIAALKIAQQSKLEPPPRALTLNLDFQVKEE